LRNISKGDNIFQQAITWKWRGFRKNKRSILENINCFIFSYIFCCYSTQPVRAISGTLFI